MWKIFCFSENYSLNLRDLLKKKGPFKAVDFKTLDFNSNNKMKYLKPEAKIRECKSSSVLCMSFGAGMEGVWSDERMEAPKLQDELYW